MSIRILLVDDDPVDREAIRRTLTKRWSHAEMIEAGSGGEGNHLSKQGAPPDVAIIDVRLKRLMGGDLAWMLDQRGIPIVMVTGNPELAPNGFTVVRKEFGLPGLVEAVEKALEAPTPH
ncbi:MAG: response regulator [Bradymonadia bacterium]